MHPLVKLLTPFILKIISIKMYAEGVCSQNGQVIFYKCRVASHSTSEQGLEQFIVLLKLKSTF